MRSYRLGGRPLGMGTPPMLLAIFLLILQCRSALAIYEDQVGKYDWIKQHVGVIRHVEVSSLPQPCIYVASTTNVVAALDPGSGVVLWRKLLDEGDTIHALAARTGVLVALSSDRHVRAFGSSGQLLWEALLPASGPGASRADIAIVPGSKGSLLVAARGGAVFAYALKSGRQVWSVDVHAPGQTGAAAAVQGDAERGEVLVAFMDEWTVTSARLHAADGSVIEQASAEAGSKLDLKNLAVLPAGIVAVSADGASVCSGAVADSAPLSCHGLGSPAAAAGAASLKRGSCAGHVAVQTAGATALFKVGGASLIPVRPCKAGAAASECFAGRDGAPVVVVAAVGDAGLELGVVSAIDGAAVKQHADASLRRVADSGVVLGVARVFGVAIDGEPGALIQLEEGSLALVGCAPGVQGAAWVRHEALASISDILFAALPAPTPQNEAEWAAGQPSLSERLRMQLLALKAQVGLALPPEQAELALHAALTSDRLRPTRDADGFRRQLLVATSAGKVAALHTGDGRLLWALDFGAAAAPQRLVPWRTPHDMRHDEEVVALRVGSAGVVATVINTRTGQVVSTDTVAATAAEVLPLPKPTHSGRVDQYVYAVVPADGMTPAAVLPRSEEGRAAFASQAHLLTHWRIDEEAGVVEGFGVAPADARRLLWRVAPAAPGSGLRILAAAARDSTEAVYAAARAVAGGGIKLKHLSPNTLLVVAGPPPERPPSPSSRLVVTLLDAASGRVLFSQTHQGASGPVRATVSENSAIYHYWSAKRERWELSSVDAYKEPPPGLAVADLALGRGVAAAAANASSWDPQPLQFDTQTFLCKLPAVTLGVTKTAHGTMARMVLIGTPAGQVYMADRRLLDPRRPVIAPGAKPTPEQMVEGLPPYQTEIAVLGPSFATLDRRVARLHTVATAPAVLESASLMVAAGLDLFYSRLQPSRGFDMVPDDFPHALLVAVVLGMAAAAVGMRTVLQKRALKLKWQ